jgi:hypothetical protein
VNKYVATLNTGRNVLHENARASLREAARRWGADYVELLSMRSPDPRTPYHEKIHLDEHFGDNCRVLYYDGDVIVRSDCPSPFEIVPAGQLGLVRSHYPSHAGATLHVERNIPAFAARHGCVIDCRDEYANTGLILFETDSHRAVFAEARRMVAEVGWDDDWAIADQGFLAVAVKRTSAPVFWIPPMLQHAGSDLWQGWEPTMYKLGYHFCGPIDKSIAIPRTVWDDLGPARFTSRGTRRWERGKPLGLNGHDEVPFFMREVSRVRGGRIVEVGCYLGGFTWYGSQIARDNYSEWRCVDHWAGSSDLSASDWHDIYTGFLQNMRDARLDDFLQVERSTSIEAAAGTPDASVDLVFIDGDHSYDQCRADIEAWRPKVKRGGAILGHDYGPDYPGVIRAVADVLGGPDEISPGHFAIWKKTIS